MATKKRKTVRKERPPPEMHSSGHPVATPYGLTWEMVDSVRRVADRDPDQGADAITARAAADRIAGILPPRNAEWCARHGILGCLGCFPDAIRT